MPLIREFERTRWCSATAFPADPTARINGNCGNQGRLDSGDRFVLRRNGTTDTACFVPTLPASFGRATCSWQRSNWYSVRWRVNSAYLPSTLKHRADALSCHRFAGVVAKILREISGGGRRSPLEWRLPSSRLLQ